MPLFFRFLPLISLLAGAVTLSPASSVAQKITTRLKPPKEKVRNLPSGKKISYNPRDTMLTDTLFAKVRFAGYDKPSSSSTESFFVTNLTSSDFTGIEVDIKYLQPDGRQLHQRHQLISINLPSGETRKVDLPTWDRQNSFIYYLSIPGRKTASPYKVHITPTAIYLGPTSAP